MYYKLKTSFLEETLSDALDDDSFDLSLLETSSQTDPRLSGSFSEISTPDVSALTSETSIILPNSSTNTLSITFDSSSTNETLSRSIIKSNADFEAETSSSINDNAWGKELTNKNSSQMATKTNALRKSMSDKLFRNSSFSKRNPRKSLSRNSLSSSQSSQSLMPNSQNDSLPDLETILSQKIQLLKEKENSEILEIPTNMKAGGVNLANSIDQDWLNRCNAVNSIESETQTTASNSGLNIMVEPPKSFGISNINVNALANLEAVNVSKDLGKSTLSFDMNNLNLKSTNSFNEQNRIDLNDDEVANSEDESAHELQFRSKRYVNKRKYNEINKPFEDTKINDDIDMKINEIPKIAKKQSTKTTVRKKNVVTKPVTNEKTEKIATRKSTRNKANPVAYTDIKSNDVIESSGEEEPDPFAGDDSDNDPNFSVAELENKNSQPISSDDSSIENKEISVKETTRKRVVRSKSIRKPKTATNQIKKPRAKRLTKNQNNSNCENEAIQNPTPDDYVMEFGLENIKSVPRIPIAELKQNTAEFTKYLCGSTNEKPTTSTGVKTIAPITKNSMAKEKLEKKVAAGSLNENYVRLNLRKKVFVRGKKTINFSRYKKKLWKEKKASALTGPDMDMGGCDGGILTCFQCGLPGHFAQNCKVKGELFIFLKHLNAFTNIFLMKLGERLLPLEADVEESQYPTLQEAEEMSKQKLLSTHINREIPKTDNLIWKADSADEIFGDMNGDASQMDGDNSDNISNTIEKPVYIGQKIPDDFLKKAGLHGNDSDDGNQIKPFYSLKADGGVLGNCVFGFSKTKSVLLKYSLSDTPDEVFEALRMFGHSEFRRGQEKAVMRILSGQSTLVTLSTGSGKSLCYQLPAYLYSKRMKCITLVISPLVSLMEDQVHGVPHFLNAQCLHMNLSEHKRAATIESIKSGDVDVLLISPEAIVASEKSTGFGSILRDLPPIAFVCIDEAHCVSQFGHNFRPSYLMVCRVLYEKLKVKTVLGLTATATLSTRWDCDF